MINTFYTASLQQKASAEAVDMTPVFQYLAIWARARAAPLIAEDARCCAMTSNLSAELLGEVTAIYRHHAAN